MADPALAVSSNSNGLSVNQEGDAELAEIVFILGAGASRQGGAPLMAEFLDVAENLWKTGRVTSHGDAFRAVFSSRGRMQAIHSKARLDLNNIESVFNAFEMARILGKFPGNENLSVEAAIEALTGCGKSRIVATE